MGRRQLLLLLMAIGCDEHGSSQGMPPPVIEAPRPAKEPSVLAANVDGADLKSLLDEFKASQKEDPFNFAHLKKNAQRYIGRLIAFSGKIVEIVEMDNETTARVALNGDAGYVFWVQAGFLTDFVEGDRVDIFGTVAGAKTYESQAGWQITLPAVLAISIQKRGTFDRLARGER